MSNWKTLEELQAMSPEDVAKWAEGGSVVLPHCKTRGVGPMKLGELIKAKRVVVIPVAFSDYDEYRNFLEWRNKE